MPNYGYRCVSCGAFSVTRPITVTCPETNCPSCGQLAFRVFGAPGLRSTTAGLRRALDASARSADEPMVTRGVPGRPRRSTPITRDPRHAKLPRP